MDTKNIDTDNLKVTGVRGEAPNLHFEGDVIIVVTAAYGPTGESLVGITDTRFDGYPAVTILVRVGDEEAYCHLSPFHGDRRKICELDIPTGARCELLCPVTRQTLDKVGHDEKTGADYFALYLTPQLSLGEMVAISDIWGDYHSRIVDSFELISSWSAQEEDVELD